MSDRSIQSGAEVVKNFLESISENDDVDSGTISEIKDLYQAGKLSRTQLEKALASQREKS